MIQNLNVVNQQYGKGVYGNIKYVIKMILIGIWITFITTRLNTVYVKDRFSGGIPLCIDI